MTLRETTNDESARRRFTLLSVVAPPFVSVRMAWVVAARRRDDRQRVVGVTKGRR
jgi:hypothetical protein